MENYFYVTEEDIREAGANGVSAELLVRRVYYQGWNKKRAINEPVQTRKLTKEHFAIAFKNGIGKETVKHRVHHLKWDIEIAITKKPIRRKNKYLDIARQNGINESTFRSRLNKGWSLEKASTTPTLSRKESINRALNIRHEKEIIII